MTGSFLSPHWYRVARLRPALRTHVEVRRHRYAGGAWYVVHDLASGRIHRFTPAAWMFVGAMDGVRTVDRIWTDLAARLEDDAPTQDEAIRLLSQLHSSDLLQTDIPPDAAEVMQRRGKMTNTVLRQNLKNPLSLRLPLWDPDQFLERMLPLCRPLLGRFGLLLWLLVVGSGAIRAGQHWPELSENIADRLLATGSLAVLLVTYPLVKLLHEFGHGIVAKAYGCAVHEVGVMLLVFVPIPYVDASASAALPDRWQRARVAAAGILVELFLAGLAMHLWVSSESGFLRAVAFNVMVIGGISTLLVNGNPLLRFDGYYVLIDAIAVPNLAPRAIRFWGYLMDRYVFRTDAVQPFQASPAERVWMALYAPLSFVYRLVVLAGVSLFVAAHYFIVGAVLAIWSFWQALVQPVLKGLWYVLTNAKLRRRRPRAVAIALTPVAAVIGAVLLVPAPLHTMAEGVVWLPEDAIVRAGTDGFIRRVVAQTEQNVQAGEVLLEADYPMIDARIAVLAGHVDELRARLEADWVNDRAAAAATALELEQETAALARERARLSQLTMRSKASGTFTTARNPADLPGRFTKEGEIVGFVTPSSARLARVVVPQDNIDLTRSHLRSVWVRLAGGRGESMRAEVVREVPQARNELPSSALGSVAGGAVMADPRDQKGLKTLERVFQLDLALPANLPAEGFGGRVQVRFEHEWEPLGWQLYRRARQLFLSHLDV
ncbi:MAG: hypothetical protein U1E70_12075 [Acetobacteraceae bacterium]